MTLDDLVFLVWQDATIDGNELHGVVTLNEMELLGLVREAFERKTGLKAQHIELRAITSEPDEFYSDLPRIKVGDDDE